MKLSRRGILGGLFAATAATAAVAKATPPKPAAPKQTFAKGMIVPRYHMVPFVHSHGGMAPSHSHSYNGGGTAMVTTDYEIFDGEKFVAFNSAAGQQVIRDLS